MAAIQTAMRPFLSLGHRHGPKADVTEENAPLTFV